MKMLNKLKSQQEVYELMKVNNVISKQSELKKTAENFGKKAQSSNQ